MKPNNIHLHAIWHSARGWERHNLPWIFLTYSLPRKLTDARDIYQEHWKNFWYRDVTAYKANPNNLVWRDKISTFAMFGNIRNRNPLHTHLPNILLTLTPSQIERNPKLMRQFSITLKAFMDYKRQLDKVMEERKIKYKDFYKNIWKKLKRFNRREVEHNYNWAIMKMDFIEERVNKSPDKISSREESNLKAKWKVYSADFVVPANSSPDLFSYQQEIDSLPAYAEKLLKIQKRRKRDAGSHLKD